MRDSLRESNRPTFLFVQCLSVAVAAGRRFAGRHHGFALSQAAQHHPVHRGMDGDGSEGVPVCSRPSLNLQQPGPGHLQFVPGAGDCVDRSTQEFFGGA